MSSEHPKFRNTACQKLCFKSEKLALKRMHEINFNPAKDNKKKIFLKSVYLCPECKKWHMTTLKQNEARAISLQKEEREDVKKPSLSLIEARMEYLKQVPKIRNKFKK